MIRGNHDWWPRDSFMVELPETERAALLAAGDPYRFEDEAPLLRQGDSGDFVYILTSGLVKVVVTAESGVPTTLALRSRGDLVGEFALLDEKPRTATAYAVGVVTALKINGPAFMEITSRSAAVRSTITRYILFKMRSATENRAADRVWDAKERVAQVLYELANRLAGPAPDDTARLPITQSDLGDLAGVAVSTVERVLKDLKRARVIATGYREIRILDLHYLGSIRFPGRT